jgi:hypothetical protein
MNTKDFLRLGVPLGEATRRATDFVAKFIRFWLSGWIPRSLLRSISVFSYCNAPELAPGIFTLGGGDKSRLHEEVAAIVANPSAYAGDPLRGEFAKALISSRRPSSGLRLPSPAPAGEGSRVAPVKYRQWGEGLEHDAVMQMERFNWKDVNRLLRERGVTLISAGLDEVPMAYKNIREVMAAQSDLVTVLGQFDPKLVKMAPSGERPED